RIRVCEIHEAAVGIDTPEDYAAFVKRVARSAAIKT
ncbi:MAG: 3-deoxy-manno-octulosonate cytidylyltransferase, partial [Planctomycetes bacterium]|nr:3-deoxy-manno-octulosonate cytidylyltransferase [Planctomycetota bacterium]